MRGGGMAAVGFAFAQALNLGFYIVLARLLTPTEFGIYAAATVLLGFAYGLSEAGFASAVVHQRDRVEEALSTAVVATWGNGVLFSLLALAAAPLLGQIFDSGQITAIAAVMAGTIFVNATGAIPDAILQRRFSFLRRLVIEPIQVVVFGVVTVVAAVNDLGVWSLVIGQYAAIAISAILAWAFARWRPRMELVSFGMWRELAAYGRHLFTSSVILRIGEQAADTAVVGTGLGTAALGQYRYAYRIAATPFQLILAGASYVIFPAFARIATDRTRLKAAFLRSLRWMSVLGFPAGLILIPLGPALAVLVFGDVWRPAGEAAMAMCAYTGASAVSSVVAEAMKAEGRTDRLVRVNLMITVVTIVAMLALLPLGLTAVAAGLSLGAIAGTIIALFVVRDVLELPLASTWREIWPPALAAVVMAAVLLPLDRLVLEPTSHGTFAGLGIVSLEGVAGVVIFAACLSAFAPGTIAELRDAVRNRRAGSATAA